MLSTTVKQLGKHSVIYGLGSVLTKLLGFVLLPIYTRQLSVADYGLFILLGITATITTIVAQLGLGSALFREVIYQESDEPTVISTTLYFLLIEGTLLFVPLALGAAFLSQMIFRTPDYAGMLRLIFLTALLHMLDALILAKLRIHNRSWLYAGLAVAKFLLAAGLNIFYLVVLRQGVEGLILAGLIHAVIFAIVSLVLLYRDLRPAFSLPILRRLLAFGVPLVPFGLSSQLMTSADRYILEQYSTRAEVGLYSLGYNLGMVMILAVGAIQLAWPAQMYTIAKQPNAEHHLARILTYYLLAMGWLALALSALSPELLVVMATPAYYGAAVVVPWIALSYLLYGVMYMTNSGLETRNKVKYMSITITASAALNLALCFLLIPRYGMMGAAWATAISYAALALAQVIINQRVWYIPYEYGRIAKVALVCGVLYALTLLVRFPNTWLNLALKLLLLAAYPFLFFLLRFYSSDEVAALRRLWRRLRRRETR